MKFQTLLLVGAIFASSGSWAGTLTEKELERLTVNGVNRVVPAGGQACIFDYHFVSESQEGYAPTGRNPTKEEIDEALDRLFPKKPTGNEEQAAALKKIVAELRVKTGRDAEPQTRIKERTYATLEIESGKVRKMVTLFDIANAYPEENIGDSLVDFTDALSDFADRFCSQKRSDLLKELRHDEPGSDEGTPNRTTPSRSGGAITQRSIGLRHTTI